MNRGSNRTLIKINSRGLVQKMPRSPSDVTTTTICRRRLPLLSYLLLHRNLSSWEQPEAWLVLIIYKHSWRMYNTLLTNTKAQCVPESFGFEQADKSMYNKRARQGETQERSVETELPAALWLLIQYLA